MRLRFQPWQLAVTVALGCAAVVSAVHWWSRRTPFDAAAMLQTLPEDRSVHLYVDLEMLRDAGFLDLLAGSGSPEEPDYRRFVEDTGFDYRVDLHAVAMAFTDGNLYLSARGNFEWSLLASYARAQGGQCLNSVCQMPATRPDRVISFYPLRPDVLALAVSAEPRGVTMISQSNWRTAPRIPPVPVWVSAPGAKFADVSSLPAGSHSFLSPLRQGRGAIFTLGPADIPGEAAFGLRMEGGADSPAVAAEIARQLTSAAELLRNMLARDNLKPNPADLSGVLASGRFRADGTRVSGVWSIDRRFLEGLLSGGLR
jgi:hypothetical protein